MSDVETSQELNELTEIAADFSAVDDALARLERGEYGVCAQCGETIDDESLAQSPFETACSVHANGSQIASASTITSGASFSGS